MVRLPGDPSPLGRVRYALGFRLPPGNRDWVRHDLTDAGWRGRILLRHLYVMVPVCLLLALLPGPPWTKAAVPLLALLASTLTVAISSDDLRRSRLHRHGLRPPER
ncbi:hypothetical protein E1293_24870 [Actinomadura darangshiensis]|uniref:DUF5313 domain-containing protein n=1 Tax=Actinomadura darangshiensis TaxID=705336 RepID=A0A4R5B078_9ACTN|nr:DUF5313 family protein [Actinomadura darangshiensis]TDD78951.1 hypothetical protein E1293_24870 [Actinomadura darangshiensis]